jgi:hypothetical protein
VRILTEPVVIAIISTFGALGAAVLPLYVSNRKKTQEVADKIGEPNGYRSIVSMLEEVLDLLRDHSRRITSLEEKVNELR